MPRACGCVRDGERSIKREIGEWVCKRGMCGVCARESESVREKVSARDRERVSGRAR